MTRIGTRAEVWFSNVVASFARYVAERTLPESVPMLMRRDAVLDSYSHAKEVMQGAYSFLDRFEGLTLSIQEEATIPIPETRAGVRGVQGWND